MYAHAFMLGDMMRLQPTDLNKVENPSSCLLLLLLFESSLRFGIATRGAAEDNESLLCFILRHSHEESTLEIRSNSVPRLGFGTGGLPRPSNLVPCRLCIDFSIRISSITTIEYHNHHLKVGSEYKALRINSREPTKRMVLVVKGIEPKQEPTLEGPGAGIEV